MWVQNTVHIRDYPLRSICTLDWWWANANDINVKLKTYKCDFSLVSKLRLNEQWTNELQIATTKARRCWYHFFFVGFGSAAGQRGHGSRCIANWKITETVSFSSPNFATSSHRRDTIFAQIRWMHHDSWIHQMDGQKNNLNEKFIILTFFFGHMSRLHSYLLVSFRIPKYVNADCKLYFSI